MAKRSMLPMTDVLEGCCTPLLGDQALDEETAVTIAAGFATLADPVRVRLLNLIAAAPDGETCVCDLTDPVGRSQPTVSHHLKLLADAGLITGDKRGRWVWYRIVPERIAQLRATLTAP